jgi:hypothetical protein
MTRPAALSFSPTQGDVGSLDASYVGGAADLTAGGRQPISATDPGSMLTSSNLQRSSALADRQTVLGVATYGDKNAAMADFRTILGLHHDGAPDHVAAAILVKDIDGRLHVDHQHTTAGHLDWGCALVGGALAVLAAPLAIVPLSVAATKDATWAGVGAIVGYFWHNIPKGQLQRMTDVLESGQAALVVVVLDHTATDIEVLLANAIEAIVAETDGGDIEVAYEEAVARDRQSS